MEQNNREEIEIDLKQIMFLLLDRWILIAVCAIFTGLIAFAITKFFMDPVYESTTETFVVASNEESTVSANDFVLGNYVSKNYVVIAQSRGVFEEVIKVLDLKCSVSDLESKVTVENITDTQIIQIRVKDADPYVAQDIANAMRIASEKEIVRVVGVPEVNCIVEASPGEKVGPSTMKNTMIGVFVGLFVAVAVIVIRHMLDDTIKSPEDIERYLGLSTLASIPVMEEAEYDGEKRNQKKKPNRPTQTNNKPAAKPKREVVR